MARFMLTIFDAESGWATLTPEDTGKAIQAYAEYTQDAKDKAVYVSGEGLQPVATAKTVSAEGVIDGPYAETKEQLGGFYVLELSSVDEAIDWAGRIPSLQRMGAKVEVRPVQEFPEE
jgi:hypothetical protein